MDTVVDKVEVGIRDQVAYVRVQGRGTFKVGPSLKQFGASAIEQGCSRIVVEMKDCVGMDSTFMGILAGLSTVIRKTDGEVILFDLSEKNLFLLKMLGLLHLVRVDTSLPDASFPVLSGDPLATGGDKRQMTQDMITAHEDLIDAFPDNIVKFKDVLAYLKEDLKRTVVP
ncbi:MAG: STAS domain-containing protein [bacterium]